jgi:hypothetical protein
MGTELAALGLYPKADKRNKVYYVNRKKFRFAVPKLDQSGKPIQKTNNVTGLPMTLPNGEPEYKEESIAFRTWMGRFTALGYWSCFEVTKTTPKVIAKILEEEAASNISEIMNEETFIKTTNPAMLDTIKINTELEKENESLKAEKSKADELIASLKKKAGIE